MFSQIDFEEIKLGTSNRSNIEYAYPLNTMMSYVTLLLDCPLLDAPFINNNCGDKRILAKCYQKQFTNLLTIKAYLKVTWK